jgi:pimeloyl-ACP methyl ester carboxylesterase
VASRPSPSELTSSTYGQRGASPNQTGRINGAAELAQFVNAGYNGGRYGPVSITPATLREGNNSRPVHLVGISGTEPVQGQSTGWATNFKSGFELSNPGLRNARDAILRTVPAGSDIVLSGHSQGGMIAQQLAADPQIKERYNVVSTVTFGSPQIGLGRREGEVHRIAAAGDPVPHLSASSILPGTSTIAQLTDQNIRSDFPITINPFTWGNGITAHSKDYTNEGNPDLARMDALGRNNPRVPATIEFNPADRQFFTSPSNSTAP